MDFWSKQQWRDYDRKLCKQFDEVIKEIDEEKNKKEQSKKRKKGKKNTDINNEKLEDAKNNLNAPIESKHVYNDNNVEKQNKGEKKADIKTETKKHTKEETNEKYNNAKNNSLQTAEKKNYFREDVGKKQEQEEKRGKTVLAASTKNKQNNETQTETKGEGEIIDKNDEWQVAKFPAPTVIFRGGWAALPSKPGLERLRHPVGQIVYTFTGGDECFTDDECMAAVQAMQKQHMAKGMPDIQFNFLVGGDMCVYEGRGWLYKATKKPIHSHLDKENTIDIAFIGDFKDKDPLPGVIEAGNGILQLGVNDGYLNPEMHITSIRDEQSPENVITSELGRQNGAPFP